MKVFVKILEICVIIDLEIDSYINRLWEKVVDYYDTRTIRVSLELFYNLERRVL